MKTCIVTLVTFFVLVSCGEDNPQPVNDPFVGSWRLSNPPIDLQISFDISQDGDEVVFRNVSVQHPEITETLDYQVETFYRYAVNAAYKRITIMGEGSQEQITINMLHNRVHLQTRGVLDVYLLEIETPGKEPVVLENQRFVKSN